MCRRPTVLSSNDEKEYLPGAVTMDKYPQCSPSPQDRFSKFARCVPDPTSRVARSHGLVRSRARGIAPQVPEQVQLVLESHTQYEHPYATRSGGAAPT